MAERDIIVIGASAGGLSVLREIMAGLPADLPAAVFVVVHVSPDNPGILAQILDRAGPLPVANARDGEPIRHGRIYVARPDHHLLVKRGLVRTPHGPKENRFRPAVDPLFRTAARAYGPRVIGIVLSGALNDGTYGLMLIKQRGGLAIVQDPAEALVPSMPQSAIDHVPIDHVLPAAEIAPAMVRLAGEAIESGEVMARDETEQEDISEARAEALSPESMSGPPSAYTCPECGGSLWESREQKLLRYQCHVGHAFTGESLLAEKDDALENALWTALRALEENVSLQRRLAKRAQEGGMQVIAEGYEALAREAEVRAQVVRDVLLRDEAPAVKA